MATSNTNCLSGHRNAVFEPRAESQPETDRQICLQRRDYLAVSSCRCGPPNRWLSLYTRIVGHGVNGIEAGGVGQRIESGMGAELDANSNRDCFCWIVMCKYLPCLGLGWAG